LRKAIAAAMPPTPPPQIPIFNPAMPIPFV
jgi:hypothetical protein